MLQRARVLPTEFDHPSTWGRVDPVGRHSGRKGKHGFDSSAQPLLSPQTTIGEDDYRLLWLRRRSFRAISWPPRTGSGSFGADAPFIHFWTSRSGCRVDRPAGARHPLFALAICLATKADRIGPARRGIAVDSTAPGSAHCSDDRAISLRSAILRAGIRKDPRDSDCKIHLVEIVADQPLLQRSESDCDALRQEDRSRSRDRLAVAPRQNSEDRSRAIRATASRCGCFGRRAAMVWGHDLASAIRSPLVVDGIAADRCAGRPAGRSTISIPRHSANDSLAHGRQDIDRRRPAASWPHHGRTDAEVPRSANHDDRHRRFAPRDRLTVSFISAGMCQRAFSPAGAFSVNQRAPAGVDLFLEVTNGIPPNR